MSDSDERKEERVRVTDRRAFAPDGTPRDEDRKAPEPSAAEPSTPQPETSAETSAEAPAGAEAESSSASPHGARPGGGAPIDFATFVISLSTSALYDLGAIPDPEGTEREPNLPLAKQTIDILELLRTKTEGNLTQEEARVLGHLLYDLRMRYLDTSRHMKAKPESEGK